MPRDQNLPSPPRFCAVIPTRDHHLVLAGVVAALRGHRLPVFVVDDASGEPARTRIHALHAPETGIEVLRAEHNLGKGGAVSLGLARAWERGFTHALQIDADGQHDLAAIGPLLEAARANPNALISGRPVYDASVPRSRHIGRWVTHVWVWIETLSFDVADSMCGFRVYPLAATLDVLGHETVGRGMDFDTEIMVRLFWRGVPVVHVPVRVVYPEGNTSNFRLLADNWLITRMHTRLFFGMLRRLPSRPRRAGAARGWAAPCEGCKTGPLPLAGRARVRGIPTSDVLDFPPPSLPLKGGGTGLRGCRGTHQRTPQHWAAIQERGTYWGLRTLAFASRLLGRRGCRVLLVPVVTYLWLTGGDGRRSSQAFLERAHAQKGLPSPALAATWRHFMSFAMKSLDAFMAWSAPERTGRVTIEGAGAIEAMLAEGKGALLMVSHLGNSELCRARIATLIGKPVSVLLHTRHAVLYNRVLRTVRPDVEDHTIQVTELGPATAIELRQRIERGEWIAIAADRTPVMGQVRTAWVPFLGHAAPFSLGPYILAGLMGCPVFLMFCLREGGGHTATFESFEDRIDLPRRNRDAALAGYAARYAGRLEHHALRDPLQWYNFYDFWAADADRAAPEPPVAGRQENTAAAVPMERNS